MAWFACAAHRPISSNTGGGLGPNLGLVLHHAVMNGSLFNFFNSPSAEVSAHFWVAQDGRIEQYVDTATVSWHGKSLNSRYVGVETEGCTSPANGYADAMSEAMVSALSRIYAEGMAVHGWANTKANADGQPGFGYHRMAVQTACPCDVRLNMRDEILRRASGQAPITTPPKTRSGAMCIIPRENEAGYWIFGSDGGVFSYGDAPYLGSLPGLNVKPNAPIVGGAATESGNGYWMCSTDGGIFCFGDAQFHGSMGGTPMNGECVGMGASGDGYWLLGRDGGIFAFDVPFHGSAVGLVAP
jgi:hypothetical protein